MTLLQTGRLLKSCKCLARHIVRHCSYKIGYGINFVICTLCSDNTYWIVGDGKGTRIKNISMRHAFILEKCFLPYLTVCIEIVFRHSECWSGSLMNHNSDCRSFSCVKLCWWCLLWSMGWVHKPVACTEEIKETCSQEHMLFLILVFAPLTVEGRTWSHQGTVPKSRFSWKSFQFR